jgi:hypothetical protein
MINSIEKGPLDMTLQNQVQSAFRLHDDNWIGLV